MSLSLSALPYFNVLPFDLRAGPEPDAPILLHAGRPISTAFHSRLLRDEGYFHRPMLGAYARVIDGAYARPPVGTVQKEEVLIEAGRVALMALLDTPSASERQVVTLRWARRIAQFVARSPHVPFLERWPADLKTPYGAEIRISLAMALVGRGASWSQMSIQNQAWVALIHGLGESFPTKGNQVAALRTGIALITAQMSIPRGVYDALLYFREREDGSGPMGIKGQALPAVAQYLGLVCWLDEQGLLEKPISEWQHSLAALHSKMEPLFKGDIIRVVSTGLCPSSS